MIEVKFFFYILGAIIAIGGSVVTFFTMQTRQNMRIEQLQKEIDELKRKQSLSTSNQIKTEKDLVAINGKLDNILDKIEELKNRGAG